MAYALPADPMSRFVAVYEMLDAERGWFGDPSGTLLRPRGGYQKRKTIPFVRHRRATMRLGS